MARPLTLVPIASRKVPKTPRMALIRDWKMARTPPSAEVMAWKMEATKLPTDSTREGIFAIVGGNGAEPS